MSQTQLWRRHLSGPLSLALGSAWALFGCELLPIDLLPRELSSVEPAPGASAGGAPAQGGSPGQVGGSPGTPLLPSGGTVASGGEGGAAPAPPPRVLFVVDEVSGAYDDSVEARLEADGRAVTRISQLDLLPGDADGFDLVVISPSADRVDLGTTLKDAPVPLLILETSVAANHGLGAVNDTAADDSIIILEPSHPIAAGHTGTVVACEGKVILSGNHSKVGSTPVASASLSPSSFPVLAFEKGVTIDGAPLPARRVVLGLLKNGACRTATAWTFFDASSDWLLLPPSS